MNAERVPEGAATHPGPAPRGAWACPPRSSGAARSPRVNHHVAAPRAPTCDSPATTTAAVLRARIEARQLHSPRGDSTVHGGGKAAWRRMRNRKARRRRRARAGAAAAAAEGFAAGWVADTGASKHVCPPQSVNQRIRPTRLLVDTANGAVAAVGESVANVAALEEDVDVVVMI